MKKKSGSSKQKPNRAVDNVFARPASYPAISALKKKKMSVPSGASLSACAMKYALAISEPFHPNARGACLPKYPSPPSHKVTGFVRFTASIGTTGLGFVSLGPCLANDGLVAYYTNSTYGYNSISPLSGPNTQTAGVSYASLSNLPYTTSQLTTGEFASTLVTNREQVQGRVVSLGVRITYVGTTLNESGVYYVWSSPVHENAVGIAQNGVSVLGALADCDVCGTTRSPCEAVLFPVSATEAEYGGQNSITSAVTPIYPFSNGSFTFNSDLSGTVAGINVGAHPLVIAMTGVAGSSYMVEVIQHCEFTGVATASSVTPSDADQAGFERVTAAAERIPQLKMAEPGKNMKEYMFTALKDIAMALKPIAISALKSGGMSILTKMGSMMLNA
jgi:hypothetical protein